MLLTGTHSIHGSVTFLMYAAAMLVLHALAPWLSSAVTRAVQPSLTFISSLRLPLPPFGAPLGLQRGRLAKEGDYAMGGFSAEQAWVQW